MNPTKMIKRHQLPCGPMAVSIDGICRRKLRDHLDQLLDRLTEETHPEGVDKDILEMEEQVDIPEEETEQEETREEKKARMIDEGLLKLEVQQELEKYKSERGEDEEGSDEAETLDQQKSRLVKEGKMKVDVRKKVKAYEDKVMPKPKAPAKPKTSDHSESEEEDLQGNSKMLQDRTGKIKKR